MPIRIVKNYLQTVEDGRAFLYLIDHQRTRVIQKKQPHILGSLCKQKVIVKRHLIDFLKYVLKKGGFSHLSRPRKQDGFAVFCPSADDRRYMAIDRVHKNTSAKSKVTL